MPRLDTEKLLSAILTLSVAAVAAHIISYIFSKVMAKPAVPEAIPPLLQHLGSGTTLADGSEQILLDFAIDKPVKVSGWVSLKNMEDEDVVILREYHRLTIDGETQLFNVKTVRGKQEQPLVLVAPKPSLKGVRITLQQVAGTYKYYPWEFFMELA